MPGSGALLGVSDVDPLDALICELERIEGHESTLQDVLANNKAVVVHPRPEALEVLRGPETPATPQNFIVQGGLSSFEVDQDLLYLDFSQTHQGPEQFRRQPFSPHIITTLRSGISGSFGQLDPASVALQDYLRRIQQQAEQVRSLINGQRQMGGKTLMPGGSSVELHSEQIKAGQNPGFSNIAPSEPPAKPRTSEGAISIEARTGVSLDVKASLVAGRRPDFSQDRLLESKGIPQVTMIAESVEAQDRGQSSSPGKSYNTSARKEHKIVKTQFYGRDSGIGQLAPQEPVRTDIWAMLRLLLYIASFGFYLFTRSTTMDARGSVPLFLYQLAVIVFEGFYFISGCLVGLWQMRKVPNTRQGRQSYSQSKIPAAENAPMPASEAPEGLRHSYRIQVIINGIDMPLSELKKTVAAMQDMQLPHGCSVATHALYDSRHQSSRMHTNSMCLMRRHEHEAVSQLSTSGLSAHDACALEASGEPGEAAGHTNALLRELYPRGNDIAATDLVAFIQAGQVPSDTFLQQAVPALEQSGVRMAYGQGMSSSSSCLSDIFNQGGGYWQEVVAPHAQSWQCTAVPANAAFLVYASSLHNMGWLPSYSRATASALAEQLAKRQRLAVSCSSSLQDLPELSIPEAYQAAFLDAQGRFQLLFGSSGAKVHWKSSFRMLLQHTLAWCTFVSAISIFFNIIPVIRIVYGVFPFNPNRWFGIGFLVYYCCFTPLLYQMYSLRKAVMVWDWTVASKLLWWQHLTALHSMLALAPLGTLCRCFQRRRRILRSPKDAELAQEAGADSGTRMLHRGRCMDTAAARDIPWRAVPNCVVSLLAACLGTWLLFQNFQTALGPRVQMSFMSLFTANLSLIIAILWGFCNGLIYSLPCHYAALFCLKRKSPKTKQFAMAFWSTLCFITVVCCMALTVIACIGLGAGAYNLQGAPQNNDYDYSDALSASMHFYAAQRSGALGPSFFIPWRGDSGLTDNPVGGYYLGTNNLKLTFPIAAALFQMAWGIASRPGSGTGMDEKVFNEIRWGTDYLVACFGNNSLVTQVGNMDQEISEWERPEDMSQLRPTFVVNPSAPGADVMAHTAAALAAASVIFGTQDAIYSGQLFDAAQSLYLLAAANEGLYSDNFAPNAAVYNSTSYLDDLMLAAAWLAESTGRPAYLTAAETYWDRIYNGPNATWQSLVPDWNNQWWAGNVILAGLTGNPRYQAQVDKFFTAWTEGSPSGVSYTPGGLALAGSEGHLRNAANVALLALVHARHSSGFDAVRLACWARSQIQYILGAGRRSYVVGWGVNPPTHIPSPAASCPWQVVPCAALKSSSPQYASPDPNPNTITGALVSGPSIGDAFSDVRSDPDTTISVEYNGGFTGALALLAAKEWTGTCGARPGLIDRAVGHLQYAVW